jgi:hypothetical protein
MSKQSLIPIERIDGAILLMRGQKVLLDNDLSFLYGVETKILNQTVKRHAERFPEDFMFQLTKEENDMLSKLQIGVSSSATNWGGRRKLPYAFTEQGVAMLSGLLNSPRAIAVNIEIMRAFVRLRQLIATHADLSRKLAALEKKYDSQFKIVFDAIRELMTPITPADKKREIGYHTTMKKPENLKA